MQRSKPDSPCVLRASFKAVLLSLTAAVSCALADDTVPDGIVKLAGGSFAAGVGYKWGHGTLSYQGREFEFCIRGLSIGDVGAARLSAQGPVYNLKSLDDFPGKYIALSGGAAIVRGEAGAFLKNKRGVTMELELQEVGVRFNMAATNVRIVMANTHGCKPSQAASK